MNPMTLTITLTPEFEERLNKLAAETRRDKNDFLREIIERGLDDVEDYYLADEVMARIRRGEEAVHSEADVRRELGLDD
jgi:RHH-type transcriptional regulator, rel operon repressor / antitoxin RelB